MGIDIGCPAVYEPSFRPLAGTKVCGTAVDDRGGCACLVAVAELLRRDRPACDTYLVGTVWEEFNLRGAMMACRTVKPDVAICLDVVLCGDTPDLEDRYESKLGAGPAMLLYTFHGRGTLNGTIPHEGLAALAQRAAGAQGIPLQRFAALGMLTDSAYLQLEGEGVASIEMGFPARYTHSPVEVCDTADLVRLGELISAMASRIDGSFDLNRY
jgi:putative aminopeptidase FrvX